MSMLLLLHLTILTIQQLTNAGEYASAASLDNPNYTATPISGTLTINPATATVSVSGYTGLYDGAAHGATGTATGVGSPAANLNSSLSLGESFTNVPGGTANWSFANPNYVSQSGTVAITINKAPVTLSFGTMTYTYDATAKSATATATPSVSGVSVSGTGTNAGEYASAASLDNPNYTATN